MTAIYGHRGASAYAPENTESAFELASAMGADGVETDVHLTKDGEVVICHDSAVDRTSDGSGKIRDKTLDELRRLNFGVKFPGWEKKETILTLDELLELLKPTSLALNIEIKYGDLPYEGIEKTVLEKVARAGMAERTIYSSFNHYSLALVKQLNPDARVGLLYSAALFEPWRYAQYAGADYIHPNFVTLYMPGVVEGCQKNGIGVHPWTVNEPEHLKWMLQLGVEHIITNYPDRALALRGQMNR